MHHPTIPLIIINNYTAGNWTEWTYQEYLIIHLYNTLLIFIIKFSLWIYDSYHKRKFLTKYVLVLINYTLLYSIK